MPNRKKVSRKPILCDDCSGNTVPLEVYRLSGIKPVHITKDDREAIKKVFELLPPEMRLTLTADLNFRFGNLYPLPGPKFSVATAEEFENCLQVIDLALDIPYLGGPIEDHLNRTKTAEGQKLIAEFRALDEID